MKEMPSTLYVLKYDGKLLNFQELGKSWKTKLLIYLTQGTSKSAITNLRKTYNNFDESKVEIVPYVPE